MIMCKVVSQWNILGDTYLLTLDSPPPDEDFRAFRIGGKIYSPLYTHNVGHNDIGVEGNGDFVGKQVEFVS